MYSLHDDAEVFFIHTNVWVRKTTDNIRHYVVYSIPLENSSKSNNAIRQNLQLHYIIVTLHYLILIFKSLCGSREKCDRNYLVSKFAYVHNIQSRLKQEVDMPQIQNWVTRYSSPSWCSVPNIRKLACVVPEKNVTEIFCDADDDARWQKWSLYVASAKAGRRHNNAFFYLYDLYGHTLAQEPLTCVVREFIIK